METSNDDVVSKHRDWLGELLNNDRTAKKTTCDLVLESEGKQFRVHKSVVMLVSNYFRKMFTIEMMEKYKGIVNIERIPHERLANIIEFIYSGKIEITEENMFDILDDAEYTEIEVLKTKCATFIGTVVSAENCLNLKAYAQRYNLDEVQNKTKQCIMEHMSTVVQHEDFAKLNFSEICAVLAERKKDCEEAVFTGIVKWVNYTPLKREGFFEKLFSQLNLTQMTPKFLAKVRNENLVKKNLVCSNQLVNALFEISYPALSYDFLLIGGEEIETECTAYSVDTLKSKILPNLNTGRFGATSVKVGNKVFIIGGADGQKCENPQSTCEMLDFNNQTRWKAIPDILKARGYCGSAHFEEHIYVTGGYNGGALQSCEKFNIYENKWKALNNMLYGRYGHGTEIYNGSIYCIGGHDCSTTLASCETYDVKGEKWNEITPLKEARCYLATALLNGAIYAIGQQADAIKSIQALKLGYMVIITGGWDGDKGQVMSTVERFLPKENKWEYVAPLQTARNMASACVLDNKIYVFGGYNSGNLSSVEVYDPMVDSWTYVFETEKPAYGTTVVAV